jgi:hypothetical protein
LSGLIGNLFSKAKDLFVFGLDNLKNWIITNPVTALKIVFPTLAISDFVISKLNQEGNMIINWLSANGIIDLPEFEIPSISEMFNFMKTKLINGYTSVKNWLFKNGEISIANINTPNIIQAFSDIKNSISTGINNAKTLIAERGKIWLPEMDISMVTKPIDKIVDKFKWLKDKLNNVNIAGAIKDSLSDSALGKATDKVTSFVGGIRDRLPFSPAKIGPLSDIDSVGKGFFSTVTESFDEKKGMLTGFLDNTFGNVWDNITGNLGNEPKQTTNKSVNNVTKKQNQNVDKSQSKIIDVVIEQINIEGDVEDGNELKNKVERIVKTTFEKIIAEEAASMVGDA